MSHNDAAWHRVGRALLGRWPSQVAQWGEEGIAAFVEELQADGLTPEMALVGLRMHRPEGAKDFPPSVAQVSALARRDPDRPTFDELLAQLYGPGGLFGVKRSGVVISQWVLKFAEDKRTWLRESLLIDHEDERTRGWARKQLRDSWDQFQAATEGRQVHEIASRSGRGTLGRVDPLAALGRRAPAQIGRGGE